MADIVPTNVGLNAVAEELDPDHVQVLSAVYSPAEIAALSVPAAGVIIKNWSIVFKVIVGSQIQILAQDLDLASAYVNARSWALWKGAPGQAGSKLLGVYVHSENVAKVAGLRSSITLYWNMTATQEASANLTNISAPAASVRTAGIGRHATQDELDAGTELREVTSDLIWPISRTKGTLPLDRGGTGVTDIDALKALVAPDDQGVDVSLPYKLPVAANGAGALVANTSNPRIVIAENISGVGVRIVPNNEQNRTKGLPVLLINNTSNFGTPAGLFVYRGGLFPILRLQPATTPVDDRYSEGDIIYLDADWNLVKADDDGVHPAGKILDRSLISPSPGQIGAYCIWLDLWQNILVEVEDDSKDNVRNIYSSTSSVSSQTVVTSPEVGDIYFQRSA